MASLVAVFCVFAVILNVGVHCKIISMQAATGGYTKKNTQTSNNFNMRFRMDQYYKGKNCIKVVRIEQTQPLRKLEEITVSCSSENWSVMNSMINYNNIFHLKTKSNKAKWALFDLGSRCIQHIYKDNGVYQMGKEETTFNRKECDEVIRTSTPYKGPQTMHSHGVQVDEEDLTGIEEDDDSEDEDEDDDDDYDWEEDDDDDEGEWEEEDEEEEEDWGDEDDLGEWEDEEDFGGLEENDHIYVEPVKPTKKPGNQPTVAASSKEEYQLINKQKVAVFSSNVAGYEKQGEENTIEGSSYFFTVQKYVKPGTEECFKIVIVWKNGVVKDNAKISCEYEDPDRKRGLNLHFEGVIYERLPFSVVYVVKDGLCLSKNYFEYAPIKQQVLSEQECQEVTGRSKTERVSGVIPGTEPISAKDFAVMEKQIVVVLKGSVKGFTAQKQSTYTTHYFHIEVQDYVKGGQCVKQVSLKRDDHDQYFERVKVPCKVTAPVITDDEDIELNFGNVIYIQNSGSVVYVVEDGVCLERIYFVVMEQVKYNERTLSLPECYGLTRWKREQRSSSEKLNKQPPPKTKEAPGLMWMLSLNGNTESGFTAANAGISNFNGGSISLQFQDFAMDERCVRRSTLKIQNVEADKFLVSCGAFKSVNMIGDQVLYGKAFLIIPGPSANTYIARFNLRERSCVKRTYTVKKGNPAKISKSQPVRVSDKECKELMKGTFQLNMKGSNNGGSMFTINGFGNIHHGGNGNIHNNGVEDTVTITGDGLTIGNTYNGGSGNTYMDGNGNIYHGGSGNEPFRNNVGNTLGAGSTVSSGSVSM